MLTSILGLMPRHRLLERMLEISRERQLIEDYLAVYPNRWKSFEDYPWMAVDAPYILEPSKPLNRPLDSWDIMRLDFRKECYAGITSGRVLARLGYREYLKQHQWEWARVALPEGFALDFSRVRQENNAKVRKALRKALAQKQEEIEKLAQRKNVSAADTTAMTTDLQLALQDEYNWQQKLAAWFNTYRAKNPVFAWLILILLAFCVEQALEGAVTTIKDAFIREGPSTGSAQIMLVDSESELLLIGEAPYYYKVRFVNPETGEEYIGWISKRVAR